jgi:protein-S-isoprenylcysteine O-methyltransferase Ste14
VYLVVIFVPAWTLDYWRGWVFFGATIAPITLITIWMAAYDKQLLERRLHGGPMAEPTHAQKIATAIGPLFGIAAMLVIVFDHRFGWSPAVPSWLSLVGDAFVLISLLTYFLVIRENRFAAATVQVAAGQTVCSSGPYAVVRHPMYAGAILFMIGAPIALGSWWGLLFSLLFIGGLAWRSVREEEFLCANLPGYREYMQRARYRLVPNIW